MPARSMRRRLGAAAAATALLAASAGPGLAQGQAAVYDPQPPPDSAYVRFVNTLGEEVALRPAFLPAARLGTKPEERVTPFAVAQRVTGGREMVVEASAGSRTGRAALKFESGSFNTVLVQVQGNSLVMKPVVDQADFNRARSRLSFYNATTDCASASAVLAPNGPAVLEQVAPGTAKARSVNPVTAEIRADCSPGQSAPAFQLSGLEAGGMYSIWLMRPDGRNLVSFISRDTTARWRG
ncbi:ABC transporter permease [Pararoseomonas sp. SCSIO 73927]|uniref:ABC transporter permease n=1 Tax=Pararoseomonas sp. SCSIO 73927 TaxID=3114537 RepID=UPI0030D4CD5A